MCWIDFRHRDLLEEYQSEKLKIQVPDMQVKEEIMTLRQRNEELEKKVKRLEKAKSQYKNEWVNAVKHAYEVEKGMKSRSVSAESQSMNDNKERNADIKKSASVTTSVDQDRIALVEIKNQSEEVARLMKEREVLISSGLYGESDVLIRELDARMYQHVI
jgi:cell division septum initiation protein DivIVA